MNLNNKNTKNKKIKTSKKVKKKTKMNRETTVKTTGQQTNFTDMTRQFDEECDLEEDYRDLADAAPSNSHIDIKKKDKKMIKKKKVTNEMKSNREARQKGNPASKSNIDIGVDKSSSQQRVINVPNTLNIDIRLPVGICQEHRLHCQEQDEYQCPERSNVYGRTKESMEAQESPSHLNVRLIVHCDTAADDDGDKDDVCDEGNNAVNNSQFRNPSHVARAATVNHVGTSHISLRPTVPFVHTEPCPGAFSSVRNAPDINVSNHQTSKINHKRSDCRSAVPTCSHADDSQQCRGTYDTKAPHPTVEHHHTSPDSSRSASLSDIRRVLHELNIKLEQYVGVNFQTELCKKEMPRENAAEKQVKQLERLVTSDAGNAVDASETSRIDHTGSNSNESCAYQGRTPNTVRKPLNTDQHLTSPSVTDPSPVRFVPSDLQREMVSERAKNSELQELVNQLTLRSSEAEERMNRLEYDLMMMPRTGKYQPTNDPDQDHVDTLAAGGNSTMCNPRSDKEDTGSRRTGIQDNNTPVAGKLTETSAAGIGCCDDSGPP